MCDTVGIPLNLEEGVRVESMGSGQLFWGSKKKRQEEREEL